MFKGRLPLLCSLLLSVAACPVNTPRPADSSSLGDTFDPTNPTTTDATTTSGESSSTDATTGVDPSMTTTVDPSADSSSESSSTGPAGVCGDNSIDPGEECDNGGADMYCDDDCTVAECGDGVMNFPAGEYCDPGPAGESETCNADCSLAECGDNVVNPTAGEQCDEGEATATCNADCTSAGCGDGIVNDAGGEECDDGGESATCNANCTDSSCGDEVINITAGETCDDGDETLTCDDDCTEVVCGDLNSNFVAGELCDDGNDDPADGCDNCFADCGNDCWGDAGCLTDGGRCIRFTCTDGASSETACDTCFGWQPITYDNWLQDGYCPDVSATYRAVQGYGTMCGDAPVCCSDPNGCAGGDNAWHFSNGANNYYVGPCLGCMEADNCTFWNNIDDGNYTRITACIRG